MPMRTRTAGAIIAGGVAILLTGLISDAFDGSDRYRGVTPRSADIRVSGDESAVIDLPDGRKVEVGYIEEKGLGERHYDPKTRKWSDRKLLHKTAEDRCQGIDLASTDGTVAVIADFGQYCYDGEPPMESIAAAASGEFTDWHVNVQEGFDGWSKSYVSEGGDYAMFRHYTLESVDTLRWSQTGGFLGPTERVRSQEEIDGINNGG
jgi:hypothetical protein